VLLALAIEAQGTGLLFLVVPALVFGAFTSAKTARATLRAVVWVYGAIALALVPRLLINLSSGGVHHVASTRNEFMVTQGYLRIVNRDFWGWPVDVGFVGYLHRVPGIVRNALGFGAAGLAVLVAASVIGSGWRGRVFVVAALAVFAAALARAEPPPFERYASPLLPGAALLAAVGAVQLLGRSAPLRVVAGAALVALAATGAYELRLTAERERGAQADLLAGPAAQMRPYITDHRGIIGVRASRLVGVDPYLDTWGTSFVTEAEWKTFLLWPSDRAVITVLQRHHIGWVAVIGPRTLESDYNNTWTQPAYGAPVRHRQRLSMSQNFCQRWSSGVYALYELGPCARVASETSG
jgi:hypothetical protein